jgi:hypothetical protein
MTDETPPAPADSPLRQRITDALAAAAFECDGKCGLPERECYDAHPIIWSGRVGGTTHVDASVTAIADAVLAVRDRYCEQLEAGRATWKRKAEEIEADRDRIEDRLERIRDAAALHRKQLISTSELYAVIEAMDPAPAHDGPSVREATANDRRWPLEKAGE